MSTTTSKLGLLLPDGTDPINRTTQLNGNWELLDDAVGMITCTSTTRPSTPFAGQLIWETDTRRIFVRNTTNTAWTGPLNNDQVVNTTADITTPYNGQVVFDLATWGLKVYRLSTTTWERLPNEATIYKAATESVTSSTTLQNDDAFSFSVAANSAYSIEGYIVYDGATDPAGGLKTAWTGPAGSSLYYTNFGTNGDIVGSSLTEYNTVVQGVGVSRGMGTLTTGVATLSFQPKGTFVIGGTAGTAQFQWAQETSNATATRILGGSWLQWKKIA